MSQYIYDFWNTENGFSGGQINAIAQTSDGYLWIGAEKGYIDSMDEIFLDAQQLNPAMARGTHILGLTTDVNGDMWIRLLGTGVIHYHGGKFDNVLSDAANSGVECHSNVQSK